MTNSDKRQLIERALRDKGIAGLWAVVATGRRQGHTWRTIAGDITERTGVTVSHETLRDWFADQPIGDDAA